MKTTARRIAALTAGALAICAGLFIVPPSANAAIIGSCGSGYYKIDSYDVDRGRTTVGRIDLYYSPTTGNNCALARPHSKLSGKVRHIWVCIEPSQFSSPGIRDCDGLGTGENFRFYAGPVYTYARHDCIDIKGGMKKDGLLYNGSAFNAHCG
ncbi:hypothetical protein [Streptomyces sp. TR02-1]|uniref:hypothetical protein n=1 Tax=Streptomyces sp. TR02-1 TaxID=3385977 RepID=UPI00399FE9B3